MARKLNAMLNVRLTQEQLRDIEEVADALGVEMAYVVRRALEHGLPGAQREISDELEYGPDDQKIKL